MRFQNLHPHEPIDFPECDIMAWPEEYFLWIFASEGIQPLYPEGVVGEDYEVRPSQLWHRVCRLSDEPLTD